MAYNIIMEIIETSIFTKQIKKLLTEDEYRKFQVALLINPDAGDVIKGSGGLRKVRWRTKSKGKRGGIRAIYYWYNEKSQIYMLLAYSKNKKDDLTAKEIKILRKLVEESFL